MKEKIKIGLIGITGVILSVLLIWIAVFYIRGGEIKRDIFNRFSYVVYEDHVELIQYHGSKKEVKIPKTLWGRPVTVIGNHCFYWSGGNNSLEKVSIPDSVEEIGIWAFEGCVQLKEIKGGRNVRIIGDFAFCDCNELWDTGSLGNSTEQIFRQAFYGCKELKEFPFCNEISVIENYAFKGTGLEKVKLPEKKLFLGIEVFAKTPWIEEQIEEFVVLNSVLIQYQGMEEIVYIPEGIKGVAYNFENNINVREVFVPSTVEYIAGDTFINKNVKKVYIPKEVMRIGIFQYYDSYIVESVNKIWDTEKTTIITTSGSPAEAYAKEFGYSCEIVEGW